MSNVARLRYEKLPVYRYLVGRAGQTMAPEALRKSIWVFAEIADRMVVNFCSQTPDVSQVISRYLEEFVVMMNAKVYNMGVLNIRDKEDNKRLVLFDEKFESQSDYLYNQVMDRLMSHKIGFNYGRYWKKHKSSNAPLLLLFRLYSRMMAYIMTRPDLRHEK